MTELWPDELRVVINKINQNRDRERFVNSGGIPMKKQTAQLRAIQEIISSEDLSMVPETKEKINAILNAEWDGKKLYRSECLWTDKVLYLNPAEGDS